MLPWLILCPRNRYLNPLPFTRERRGYPPPQQQGQHKEFNIAKDTNSVPLIDSSGYMLWLPGIFPPPGIDPSEVSSSATSDIELHTSQNPQESKIFSREGGESFFF
jgi:hypothetical protein